jgi:hypothetical protein
MMHGSTTATTVCDDAWLCHCDHCVQEGMALYQQAMEQSPDYAPALYNMGVLNSETHQVRLMGMLKIGTHQMRNGCVAIRCTR